MSFSLTSDAFIWGLRVALVVVFVLAVVRWPKAAVPGVVAVLRRVVILLVLMVLGTVNLLAPVNAEYGWYPTVADLLPGSDEQPGVTSKAGEPARASIMHDLGPNPATAREPRRRDTLPVNRTPVDHGGYQDYTVRGRTSGVTSTVTVWFPPSYDDPKNATREYPVIEGFHGIKPAPYAFFRVVHIDQLVRDQAAAGTMREPIVVIPHWAPDGKDNECVNGPAGSPQMEAFLAVDVPAWIHDHFRVAKGRDSWNAWGMSAGGWCANMVATLHPKTFGSAISLGGYWFPNFEPEYVPFRKGDPLWRRYDLIPVLKQDPPSIGVWTLTASDDDLSYESSKQAANVLRPPLSMTTTFLERGGHRTDVWLPHIPDSLRWLGANAAGFRHA